MALVQGKRPLFDTVNTKRKIINGLGATRTLSVDESGSTIVFDRAAGIVVTLPLAVPGLQYDFMVTTSVTSNSYKVITGAATEFLIGGYMSVDTDTANAVAVFTGNGSTHIAVTSNGTTTGGLIGTKLRFTCLSATRWEVEGMMMGSGTVATAFATS
jgi:hypothetical protein